MAIQVTTGNEAMNKSILALSTALTIFTFVPAMAQNNQAPATVDCTIAANANDPACMKNGTNATGGMTTQNNSNDTTATQPADQTQTMSTSNVIVPADQLNNARVMSANDYIGKTVYDQNGNNIGEVNDIILSQDGKINAVILGVGGFLGIGEKDVAVSMSSIKVVNDDNAVGANNTTTTTDTNMANNNNATGTGTGTTTTTDGTVTTDTTTTGSTTAANDTNNDGTANLSNRRLVVETTKEALNAAPTWDRTNRRYMSDNQ
jgi:sporulation protein YlmC with PRC-barrel domain